MEMRKHLQDLVEELLKIEAFSVDEKGKRIVAEPLNCALSVSLI